MCHQQHFHNIDEPTWSKSIHSWTSVSSSFIAGVDCAKIEIDSEEVPIMDGSAKEFLSALRNVKLKNLINK